MTITPARQEYNAAYRQEHKAELAAYAKRYRPAYRAEHKEEIAAYNAAYGATYRAEHKKKITAYNAAYRASHKEEFAAYLAEHRAERAAKAVVCGAAQVADSYALAGSACQQCGESDPDVLCWHHSKLGGWRRGGYPKELQGHGSKLPQAILAYFKKHGCLPEGFELLCANCHKHANTALRDLQAGEYSQTSRWRYSQRAEVCALFGNACPCGCADLFVLEKHHSNGGGHAGGYASYPPELRCVAVLLDTAILHYIETHHCLPPDIELLCANCHTRLRGKSL